jgi:hypothetical protein
MIDLAKVKAEVLALANVDPQRAHLLSSEVTVIEGALAKLAALGHGEVEAKPPQEWPKWIDGVLHQDQAAYDAAQPAKGA